MISVQYIPEREKNVFLLLCSIDIFHELYEALVKFGILFWSIISLEYKRVSWRTPIHMMTDEVALIN